MPPMDRVGVVLDTPYFLRSWTPLAIEKAVRPFYPAWSGDRYRSLLTRLGVPTDTRLKDMSRGTGMKLQMAVALAHEPTLLVLDEPTSGLDPLPRRVHRPRRRVHAGGEPRGAVLDPYHQ